MTFFEFTSTWLFGVVSVYLSNDSIAIVQCREDLLQLEKILMYLNENLKNTSRSRAEDYKIIKNIEEILKKLNVHYASLFIKCYDMQKIVEQSLARIMQMETNADEPQNKGNSVAVDLLGYWGSQESNIYKPTKINLLQNKFLHKGFFGRLLHFARVNPVSTALITFVLALFSYLEFK